MIGNVPTRRSLEVCVRLAVRFGILQVDGIMDRLYGRLQQRDLVERVSDAPRDGFPRTWILVLGNPSRGASPTPMGVFKDILVSGFGQRRHPNSLSETRQLRLCVRVHVRPTESSTITF
jgi:hypothetical protein